MSDTPHVAVTGAAGFIGSRIVHQLQADHPDWEVTALDNFFLGNVRQIGEVSVQHVDIRQRTDLEAALSGADVVVHMAALSGVEDCDDRPNLAFETNVQGTDNVAWFCKKSGAALVFPFSVAVLGDPDEFPITTDLPRDPLNWYGRTKVLGERAIETFAEGAFPAHQFMITNLYGSHEVDGQEVTKRVVLNFFVDRALKGQTLTVYEPGSQARNYVHVHDVADAFVRSAERLLDAREAGETGSREFTLGTDEDPGVLELAELVQDIAREEHGIDADVELVENPRSAETLVDEFTVDASNVREELGWDPTQSVEDTIRELLQEE